MDTARHHWEILQELGTDLASKVRSFMVIGEDGEGVLVTTEDGDGFWLGEIPFGRGESRTANKPTPLDVSELVWMAHGFNHILLLNKRGEIYSMGWNDNGQLGIGIEDEEIHFSPQLISSQHKFASVSCGKWHNLALTDDGKVWGWGLNNHGQVCGGSRSSIIISSPHQISELDLHQVVTVECGGYHSLALTDRGEVYGWGMNRDGQLGDESRLSKHTPTLIPTLSPVKSMAAGECHTLLLTQTGEVWACGLNGDGQLGLPTDTESSPRMSKVADLPPILQIASHPATSLSIAMSHDMRCFVWGEMSDGKLEEEDMNISISTPMNLPPIYSTVESALASFSFQRNTPHSVTLSDTPPSRLSTRMSRMFDNLETSPDVQFVVEEKTIHAHRNILSNSSDYFARMFSERWLPQINEDPIVKVTIPDHSYEVFYSFLRFLYTDYFEVHSKLLPELFELAIQYLDSDLQQLCLWRMRTTLTPATCCLYYPLIHRHSQHPELATFQQELVQFVSTRMSEVANSAAYQSMETELCDNLTNAVQNILNI